MEKREREEMSDSEQVAVSGQRDCGLCERKRQRERKEMVIEKGGGLRG